MDRERIKYLVASLLVVLLCAGAFRAVSRVDEVRISAAAGSSSELAFAAPADAGAACERRAQLVDLELELLIYGGEVSSIFPLEDVCSGAYELAMVSGDRNHEPGLQTSQTEEQWQVEFVDQAGATVTTTSPTDDVPEDRTIVITTEGLDLGAEVAGVRVRHTGQTGKVNSVEAIALAILPRSTEVECDDRISTVYLDGPPLLAGDDQSVPFDSSGLCLCASPHVVAVSQDLSHRAGYQPGQTDERWTVAAKDADGQVLDTTAATADLPEDRWARADLLSLSADVMEDGVTFTVTNVAETGPNSIDPVAIVLAAR